MKQAKKLFTRMLINHWGGIDHQVIQFHEYVNLFSGKSGSGKSTVMDAMQVVLYGSIRNDFLNKAADDTRNKRSVLSYLRGAQKDGTANREDKDFCSQIVLEIQDTGSGAKTCVGVAFEVARGDQDVNKYCFFSHCGGFPEDGYLSETGIPFTCRQIQDLIQERSEEKSTGQGAVNRIYPTQEAYLNTVNDVIFGYVDHGRFKTMEKSAIALRMTNGTGQFIKDYMFPRSKEDTIAAISDQLASYREIKEQVESLEKEIAMLEEIQRHDQALTKAQADQIFTEAALKVLDIQDKKDHLAAKEEEFAGVLEKLCRFEKRHEELKKIVSDKGKELSKRRAELYASDFGKKKEQLQQLEETMKLCANEVADWRALTRRLRQWDETEGISEYLSNQVRNLLNQVCGGQVTEEAAAGLKRGLKETFDSLCDELNDCKDRCREIQKEYQEKKEILDDLRNDKKHHRKELKEARRKIQEELSVRHGRTIHVEILADLFDVTQESWRNALEGRLGRIKFGLVVEPRYALEAAAIFRKMKKKEYQSVDLINTDAILRDHKEAAPGTLYDAVTTDIPYVDACLKRYLGHIRTCSTIEELSEVRDGVTQDCYSYSNYMFRHLREQDYRYQSIGRKVSPAQILKLEQEVHSLNQQLIAVQQEIATLKQADDFERLQHFEYHKLRQLAASTMQLEKYQNQADQLQREIQELEEGTLIADLIEQKKRLKSQIKELEQEASDLHEQILHWTAVKGEVDKERKDGKEALALLEEGFTPEPKLQEQVLQVMREGKASSFKKEKTAFLGSLQSTQEAEEEARGNARLRFMQAYPSYQFGGMERENTCYDELLERCRRDFEPEYKAEFDKQYGLVYRMLRENVIAAIHGEIKAAKRHRREINSMLAKIKFSDSIYQIDILPTDDENQQFYEMLTAQELDMKLPGGDMEGQLCLGEDAFYQKYEQQIQRLTDKFMPPRDQDQAARASHRKDMAKYADYRTYLKFSMYEQAEDADGNLRKNYVDDMAGRDSGGEGQNPKYVALFAGFAMLYMQQSSRESKIRLVLLDEAFSKMDKERSEVCLRYARSLNLQLIVCVPDERLQSLIRNVDCVYAFRRKSHQISMIHIDKGKYLEMLQGETDEREQ